MVQSFEEAQTKLREYRRKSGRIQYYLDRQAALDAYGGKCTECGCKDRSELMVMREFGAHWGMNMAGRPIKSGAAKFKWLRVNGYPGGFVIMCRACKPRHRVGAPPRSEAES